MANITKIKSIWKYLTQEAATTLLLMLCISHMDYANAMLYNIPDKDPDDLQDHPQDPDDLQDHPEGWLFIDEL